MSAPDGDPVRIPSSSEPYKASLVETAASTGGDACIKGNDAVEKLPENRLSLIGHAPKLLILGLSKEARGR